MPVLTPVQDFLVIVVLLDVVLPSGSHSCLNKVLVLIPAVAGAAVSVGAAAGPKSLDTNFEFLTST